MVRVVEPGDVEVWVGSHAGTSLDRTSTQESTGGVISNSPVTQTGELPGTETERAVVSITGEVHELTTADPRLVEVTVDDV
jgi:beta-glucosidase